MEHWLRVEEFPKYSVSSLGRVRNDATDRIMLRQSIAGHLVVGFNDAGAQYKRGVAKLVASTFLPPPEYEHFTVPIHLDGELENCRADNLMWKTRWFATQYTRQFRRYLTDPTYIKNTRTKEVLDIWELVVRHGLLYMDIVEAIEECTVVFPIMERFEWT